MARDALTALERDVLDFAGLQCRHAEGQEAATRARLEVSATRHRQLMRNLLQRPAALEYAPETVHRLRRLVDAHRERRGGMPVRQARRMARSVG
jgi:hypothetical protein